jgi:hypothetical protein
MGSLLTARLGSGRAAVTEKGINMNLDKAEPHLASLKLICLSVQDEDYDLGRQLGAARFNLFKAIKTGDLEGAQSWLNTLKVALGCLRKGGHPAADDVAVAIKSLSELLECQEAA